MREQLEVNRKKHKAELEKLIEFDMPMNGMVYVEIRKEIKELTLS